MAGTVSLTLSSVPKYSLKPLLFFRLSTPFPSKHTKRKNYLRPKILKTLTKPFPSSTPINPITPIESQPETKPLDVVVFEPPSDETNKVEEFRVSETPGVVNGENSGGFGKLSPYSVMKFGFYFVGIFLFQTLIAVWVMGNWDSEGKDRNLRKNRSKNGEFLNNGKVGLNSRTMVYCDESELEEKVEEIRAMAREARKIEKKEPKNGDEEDETLNSRARIGIEKEIGTRLSKLEKKLNSKKDTFPGSYSSFLDELNAGDDEKEVNKRLFVKKKFKFRGPEKSLRSGVKGFSGLKDGSKLSNKNGVAANASRFEEVDDGTAVVSQDSVSLPSNREKIEEEELGSLHDNTSAGSESSEERLSNEAIKSMNSRDLDTLKSKISTKENPEAKTKSDKVALLRTSKRRDVSNKPPVDKVKGNQLGFKTDPWWLNLPYVLVILMQRGDDLEGLEGLFTIQLSSEGQEQSKTSCVVAFEDRSDANNFCYLLECFFEDLGDFSADIIPMSVKELNEAVKSHAKEVIVVQKGQLKLYAGQPFAEVEMALQSLIENNQNASIANSE
ncbi:ATP-binding cassette sub-family C member 11 [Gossypium australe]|uniref:ATP-binding cassette sub-family C member 11 n=1 Tax=Gossypium australe TaxID=47621 RepID=A0A5B6UEJ6_9ROSI|nr:ATP-binding cassette sub-family C member 11 [Gossypium australe]